MLYCTAHTTQFIWNYTEATVQNKAFTTVVKITFYHGKATVKRDLSDNKSLLVENLQTKCYIYQRLVVDHMRSQNLEPCNFPISKYLPDEVKEARQRYNESRLEKGNPS